MAERSFKQEVQKLRLGAGEEFRGEGILAVTKALLQCGVGYVGGYQGAPISHLMDVLADAQDLLAELDVHYEANASESAASAMLAASVHQPIRGAVTFKAPVGINVASDALANLSSGGVTGGALILIGEDYGEGSSIMQERSHAYATKSQIWLLDPRPNLPSIVKAVADAFELSEASNTPVMLELRIRACHVYGSFTASDNRRPPLTVSQALDEPRRNTDRIVLPPASYVHEQEKVNQRWPAAVEFIRGRGLNEIFGPSDGPVGIVMQGGMYNGVIRALQRLGLADVFGDSRIPLYVLNVTYPLVDSEFLAFCEGKQALLVVEEGQPAYIEDALAAILYRAQGSVHLTGKDLLPPAGEYIGQHVLEGVGEFLKRHAPEMLRASGNGAGTTPAEGSTIGELAASVPVRPPSFCTGCPERPIFAAMKLAQKEVGPLQVAGDIGCHLFGSLAPFEIGGTTMGYGLGPASNAAFDGGGGSRRPVSLIGDGGFWHNGLTSSIGNAVFNKSDSVIVVVDNFYSAATGGQDIPSSRADNPSKSTRHPISAAVKGIGVDWVREVDHTYDVGKVRDTFKEALSAEHQGPKVIVASSECMLNRQRREKPLASKAIADGERVIKPRFGVDEDICTGDHACIRLSGCPSLSLKTLDDPLRDDPVAHIDQTCVGCGNCGEVAEAAVLCPSFYRIDVVHNPGWLERLRQRLAAGFIALLQRRRARRVLGFDPA